MGNSIIFTDQEFKDEDNIIEYLDGFDHDDVTNEEVLSLYNFVRNNRFNISKSTQVKMENLYLRLLSLDIPNSTKAYIYYLLISFYYKNTHIQKSFDKYLEYLNNQTDDFEIDSMIKNVAANIYVSLDQMDEALILLFNIINDQRFKKFKIFQKIIFFINISIIYARQRNILKAYNFLEMCENCLEMNKDSQLYNRCNEVIKFEKFHVKCLLLNDNKDLQEIKSEIEHYFIYLQNISKNKGVIPSVDVHLDIINCLIRVKLYEEALKAIDFVVLYIKPDDLDKAALIKTKVNIYNKQGKEVEPYIIDEYMNILEDIKKRYIEECNEMLEKKIALLDANKKIESLEETYYIDNLTLCYNRNAFMDFVENNNGKKTKGVMFFLDLDNLKQYNDKYGHLVGDKYISIFCKLLKNFFFGKYKIYRIGGDEFVIIADSMIKSEAIYKIEGFISSVKQIHYIDNNELSIKFSCGIFNYDSKNIDYNYVLAETDKLMYKCKSSKTGWYITN